MQKGTNVRRGVGVEVTNNYISLGGVRRAKMEWGPK